MRQRPQLLLPRLLPWTHHSWATKPREALSLLVSLPRRVPPRTDRHRRRPLDCTRAYSRARSRTLAKVSHGPRLIEAVPGPHRRRGRWCLLDHINTGAHTTCGTSVICRCEISAPCCVVKRTRSRRVLSCESTSFPLGLRCASQHRRTILYANILSSPCGSSYVVRALQADSSLPFDMDRLKAFVQLEAGSWTRHRDWILQKDRFKKS